MENTINIHTIIFYVWLSILTAIYFGRILFKNWRAKRANLGFGLGLFSANVDFERIKREKAKTDKSAEETIKKFEEKEKLDKKTIGLAIKAVVRNYKSLTENQQKLLLEKQGKIVRLEEEIKSWKRLYSWVERDKETCSKENKEFENKLWQLKYILSWHGFNPEDIDAIVDENVYLSEWKEKPKIKKKEEEITQKRFKCDRCDKCNKN